VTNTSDERRILLVDDNPQYRAAVKRNLTLADYFVIDAEDSDEGMEKIQTENPQVIITDLDMRTHDEGLHFIREVKKRYPHIPMIMISAVGTFDEGALARQYGAIFVISKSRIDAEIDTLYQRLDRIYEILETIRQLREQIDDAMQQNENPHPDVKNQLEKLLQTDDLDTGLKSVVYDIVDLLEQPSTPEDTDDSIDTETILTSIENELPEIKNLDQETRTMLAIAENMQSNAGDSLSIERNIIFSYSFAVENEVKLRIGRKVNRILSEEKMRVLANQLYDSSLGNLDLFFNQYLVRAIQQHNLELNSDITRQVLERIIKHGSKYKPDGLKALGVILYCWGQNHTFSNRKGKIEIQNPLTIKGLDNAGMTQLSSQLILLQHLRNPYIHPEFSEREKIESVRKTTLACLSLISHVV
jgi:DNA-binding NarL/FixJ family response regulator